MIKASLDSVEALESLVNPLAQFGNVTTSIVLVSWTNDTIAESP